MLLRIFRLMQISRGQNPRISELVLKYDNLVFVELRSVGEFGKKTLVSKIVASKQV